MIRFKWPKTVRIDRNFFFRDKLSGRIFHYQGKTTIKVDTYDKNAHTGELIVTQLCLPERNVVHRILTYPPQQLNLDFVLPIFENYTNDQMS